MASTSNIQPESVTALPVKLLANGKVISTATASVFEYADRYFLVSNWHVFSGRDCYTSKPLDTKNGVCPDEIEVMLHRQKLGVYTRENRIRLMDSDGRFLWFQHEKGQEIDLAGIEVVGAESEFKFWPPDQTKQLPIRISCGVDTFMLGFPENVAAQDIFPIWKRGTIAAEPSIDRLDQLPIYLVDAATGKGMSGSPTFAYSANGYIDEENNYQFGVSGSRFLGIYSGRYGGIGEANLTMGRVWKAEVVYEMLDKRSPGKVAKSQRSK